MTTIDYRVLLGIAGCLTVMEIAALHYGINGQLFTVIAAVLAGIAGLSLPQLKTK